MSDHLRLPAGVSTRGWADPGDWSHIADLNNAYTQHLKLAEWVTAAEVRSWLEFSEEIDRHADYLFIEHGSDVIGYGLASTYLEHGGRRVYRHNGKVHPEWTGKGLGSYVLDWLIARHEGQCGDLGPGVLQTEAYDRDPDLVGLLTDRGFEPVAHDAHLVRPDLDDLPERPLPSDVEIRPVVSEHLRPIWEAESEAFKDHWGERMPTEGDWKAFLEFAHRDESLWKVAWHGDQVVGMVRGYVNDEENEAFGIRRGWCEFISTHRDWRGRGIASALIVATLTEFRSRGLEQASLGVHVENPTGAYSLYTGLGFELFIRSTTFERPLCR